MRGSIFSIAQHFSDTLQGKCMIHNLNMWLNVVPWYFCCNFCKIMSVCLCLPVCFPKLGLVLTVGNALNKCTQAENPNGPITEIELHMHIYFQHIS